MVSKTFSKLYSESESLLNKLRSKYQSYDKRFNNVNKVISFWGAEEEGCYDEAMDAIDNDEFNKLIQHIRFKDHMIDYEFNPNILDIGKIILDSPTDERLILMRMFNIIINEYTDSAESIVEGFVERGKLIYFQQVLFLMNQMFQEINESDIENKAEGFEILMNLNYVYGSNAAQGRDLQEFGKVISIEFYKRTAEAIMALLRFEEEIINQRINIAIIMAYIRSALVLMDRDLVSKLKSKLEEAPLPLRECCKLNNDLIMNIFDNLDIDKEKYLGRSRAIKL